MPPPTEPAAPAPPAAVPEFALAAGEPLTDGLVRVAAGQLEWAQACLEVVAAEESTRPDVAVHELRKATKRLRALLQLLRDGVGGKWRKRMNRGLRELSNDFAGIRDALVQHATLVDLAPSTPRTEKMLKRELRGRHKASELRQRAGHWIGEVGRWRQDLDSWRPSAPVEYYLAKNLRHTLKRARKAWDQALATGAGEAFHDTRKPVKRLWYMACLLKTTDEDLWLVLEPALDQWADLLGSDHDLHVLHGRLEGRKHSLPSAGEWKQIQRERERRQQQLRAAMRQPAAVVLQWKPRELERRARKSLAAWPGSA